VISYGFKRRWQTWRRVSLNRQKQWACCVNIIWICPNDLYFLLPFRDNQCQEKKQFLRCRLFQVVKCRKIPWNKTRYYSQEKSISQPKFEVAVADIKRKRASFSFILDWVVLSHFSTAFVDQIVFVTSKVFIKVHPISFLHARVATFFSAVCRYRCIHGIALVCCWWVWRFLIM